MLLLSLFPLFCRNPIILHSPLHSTAQTRTKTRRSVALSTHFNAKIFKSNRKSSYGQLSLYDDSEEDEEEEENGGDVEEDCWLVDDDDDDFAEVKKHVVNGKKYITKGIEFEKRLTEITSYKQKHKIIKT